MNSTVALPIVAAPAMLGADQPLAKDDGTASMDVALKRLFAAEREFYRLNDQLEEASHAAKERCGLRPFALVRWRNYSHIGDAEIEQARETFLHAGEDHAATIELEYLAAKKRYRAAVRAGKAWDKRAGVAGLTKALADAGAELEAAAQALRTVKIRSVADAAALMGCLRGRIDTLGDLSESWELAALINVSDFLQQHHRSCRLIGA